MNKKLLLATPLSLMVMFTLPGCDDVDFDDTREEMFEESDGWGDDEDDWDDALKPKKAKARTKPKRTYKPKRKKRSSFSISSSSRKRR